MQTSDEVSALYIDADPSGFAYRDHAADYFRSAGYAWLPPFLGARASLANSQFARALPRAAEAADIVVLRFVAAPLSEQWAFNAPELPIFGRRRCVAVLDSAARLYKPDLDKRLGAPVLLIDSPGGLVSALRAAAPPLR